jgi:RHS repeat-associated protein
MKSKGRWWPWSLNSLKNLKPLSGRRLKSVACLRTFSFTSQPFGECSNCNDQYPDASDKHFTGKERDAESGLDYFGARYYASSMGRFMSPDWAAKAQPVPYAKLDNPQSLNLYSYVLNNPLSKTDPDGHCIEDFCILEGAAAIAALESPAGQAAIEEGEEFAERNAGVIDAALTRASSWAGAQLAKAGNALEEAVQKHTGLARNGEHIMENGEANGAAFRKPDLLSKALNVIGEVKDTAKLNLTKQLGDYLSYAKSERLSFNLYTRDGTKFSEPLLKALEAGKASIFQLQNGKWVDVSKQLYATIPKK